MQACGAARPGRKLTEVSVVARFDLGTVTPLTVLWRDGRHFRIDRVLDVREGASELTQACGTCYRVLIAGRTREVWSMAGRWYVEEFAEYPYG